jgi:hypothetical protein
MVSLLIIFKSIKKFKQLFPDKKVVVAFPPARFSFALEKVANASFVIGRKKLLIVYSQMKWLKQMDMYLSDLMNGNE